MLFLTLRPIGNVINQTATHPDAVIEGWSVCLFGI